jgi:ABC-type branched-subunit amino acid transport system ATPase component
MLFEFQIPGPNGDTLVSVQPGSSVVFVGANGGGKTRLAVHIENALGLKAHRISAHRALMLNPRVPKINEELALSGLRFGNAGEHAQIGHRAGNRWHNREAIALLQDFDFVIQALFADQSNKSLQTHTRVRSGVHGPADPTKFERLTAIWERLLPHRHLQISGDDIEVSGISSEASYPASEMSDGERAIFYMIGQTLLAADNSLLIIDEPELHVHPSIMAKLWDELESTRQDCGFFFITHDLTFAASRVAQKFVIREYQPTRHWTIEKVPENTGVDEEITTLILGSRRPILFVEGDESSLDVSIYRCCYPGWTVIPRGSCEEVIHSVVTMRRNQQLTRVTCSGLVDADDYDESDIEQLRKLGIAVLPVSEVENIVLLPAVSWAIAESEGYLGDELEQRLNALERAVFETLSSSAAIEGVVLRYCRRRVDRLLKKVDLSGAKDTEEISAEYARRTSALDIPGLAKQARNRIEDALRTQNLSALLAHYDNKGLLALAATHLKRSKRSDFENWLTRVLRNNRIPALTVALRESLPIFQPY